MDNSRFTGQAQSPAYDFRVYDRVWQRVAPGADPFAEDPAAAGMTGAPQEASSAAPEVPAPQAPAAAAASAASAVQELNEAELPGAMANPCCMGTSAMDSLEVLEGFVQEELAESRYCQALACRVRNQQAAMLLNCAANEKRAAARELSAAHYLITGTRYNPTVTVEQLCWENLPQALRALYHQEACNGLNYQRAADETMDICLQKLLNRLGQQAYRRAEQLMALLSRLICC